MVPPPSSLVTSFDWNRLARFHFPSYVPFQIIVQVCKIIVSSTIIDEGASVSILSSTTWQELGFPPLVPATHNLLGFNRGTSQPLQILPQFPINFGQKTIYLNVMVVLGPLDYNLLLGCDYVYDMGAIVSTLFQVICFPHEGKFVTVSQLSFPGPNMAPSQTSSLNGPFVPMVSSPPRVNYVATCSIPTSTDNQFSDVVHHVLGALELDLSFMTYYVL